MPRQRDSSQLAESDPNVSELIARGLISIEEPGSLIISVSRGLTSGQTPKNGLEQEP